MAATMDDEERNAREEAKGDLDGGQLWRANREARGETPAMRVAGDGRGGRIGAGGKRMGRSGGGMRGAGGAGGIGGGAGGDDGLVAAMKPAVEMAPLAKGYPAEVSKDLFWNEPIPRV